MLDLKGNIYISVQNFTRKKMNKTFAENKEKALAAHGCRDKSIWEDANQIAGQKTIQKKKRGKPQKRDSNKALLPIKKHSVMEILKLLINGALFSVFATTLSQRPRGIPTPTITA